MVRPCGRDLPRSAASAPVCSSLAVVEPLVRLRIVQPLAPAHPLGPATLDANHATVGTMFARQALRACELKDRIVIVRRSPVFPDLPRGGNAGPVAIRGCDDVLRKRIRNW
jgi:hypothetical protein